MKKDYFTHVLVVIACFLASNHAIAQTSLFFETKTTNYPKRYKFSSGDVMYFSDNKNTSETRTCSGSQGESRQYRIQENTFVLELKSTSMSSLTIFGSYSGKSGRVIHKVETASSKNGNYVDVTKKEDIENGLKNGRCGVLKVKNLNIPKGNFVRVTISLADNTLPANIDISELYITPVNE